MPKEIMGILTYTADETAAILGVTKRTLISYLKTGKIVAGKIGGRWAITEKQIKDFITQGSIIDNRPGSIDLLLDTKRKRYPTSFNYH